MEEQIIKLPPGELIPHQMSLVPTVGDRTDWGHAPLDILKVWDRGLTGLGVKVAVLDTGVQSSHPDLEGAVIAKRDWTGSRSGAEDAQGHGTHCAGVIGGRKNNIGLIGVAYNCSIINGKILSDSGSGIDSWIAAGIDWSVSQGAQVISGSFGAPSPSQTIIAAANRAIQAGCIVVFAAGNEGPGQNTVGFPGGAPGMVCVGAVDKNLLVANFSSRGPQLIVGAPGVQIESAYIGSRYAVMSGTSMATPYVAGVAALYVEYCLKIGRKPSQADFLDLLSKTSRDLGTAGRDNSYGYGLVQPVKILDEIKAPVPPPVVPPPVPSPKQVVFATEDFTASGLKKLNELKLKGFSFNV